MKDRLQAILQIRADVIHGEAKGNINRVLFRFRIHGSLLSRGKFIFYSIAREEEFCKGETAKQKYKMKKSTEPPITEAAPCKDYDI
jgi:hypothetical protein